MDISQLKICCWNINDVLQHNVNNSFEYYDVVLFCERCISYAKFPTHTKEWKTDLPNTNIDGIEYIHLLSYVQRLGDTLFGLYMITEHVINGTCKFKISFLNARKGQYETINCKYYSNSNLIFIGDYTLNNQLNLDIMFDCIIDFYIPANENKELHMDTTSISLFATYGLWKNSLRHKLSREFGITTSEYLGTISRNTEISQMNNAHKNNYKQIYTPKNYYPKRKIIIL